MTYKEKYEKCASEKELSEMVERDANIALFLGSMDRLTIIEKAANEVLATHPEWESNCVGANDCRGVEE